jgi:hypothetical protein
LKNELATGWLDFDRMLLDSVIPHNSYRIPSAITPMKKLGAFIPIKLGFEHFRAALDLVQDCSIRELP